MPSERVQRRIETLLDEADEAISAGDWTRVRTLCDSVLRLDPANADAQAYIKASEQDTGLLTGTDPTHVSPPPMGESPDHSEDEGVAAHDSYAGWACAGGATGSHRRAQKHPTWPGRSVMALCLNGDDTLPVGGAREGLVEVQPN